MNLDSITAFIDELDSYQIATESGEMLEVSPFFEKTDDYLDMVYRNELMKDKSYLYTDTLSSDSKLYTAIETVCNDLIKVNAYTEALSIYSKYIDIITETIKKLPSSEKDNLQWTLDELKNSLIRTIGLRDEYTSNRKSILAKYSDLISKIGM